MRIEADATGGRREVKVIALITTIDVDDRIMKVFFQKHPFDLTELDAIKMIDKKVDLAVEKCERGDNSYLEDLAKAYEMIEDYFSELELNPTSLL